MSFIYKILNRSETTAATERLVFPAIKSAVETDNFDQFTEGLRDLLSQVGLPANTITQIIGVNPESEVRQNLHRVIYLPVRDGFLNHKEEWSEEIRLNVGDGQSKLFIGITEEGGIQINFVDPDSKNDHLAKSFSALK